MTLSEMFESFDDEYIKFERIENPLSKRPDLCAFLMLDRLMPGDRDIISASEHDEFYLDIDCEAFVKVATPVIVRDLVRCGIRYDSDTDSLCMLA